MARVRLCTTKVKYKVLTKDDEVKVLDVDIVGAYKSKRIITRVLRRGMENIDDLTFIEVVSYVVKEEIYNISRRKVIEFGKKISEKELN